MLSWTSTGGSDPEDNEKLKGFISQDGFHEWCYIMVQESDVFGTAGGWDESDFSGIDLRSDYNLMHIKHYNFVGETSFSF